MTAQVVRASEMAVDLGGALDPERPVPTMAYAVGEWALPKIAENYAAQEALIERKVSEAEEGAKRLKESVQARGRSSKAGGILAGGALLAAAIWLGLLLLGQELKFGLWTPLGEASLVWGGAGGMAVLGVTLLVLRINRHCRQEVDSIDGDLARRKSALRDIAGELEPDAVLRVGTVYWAFELVQHPNGRRVPVNLAASTRADAVRLVCLGDSARRAPGHDGEAAALAPESGLDGALSALEACQSELAGWQVDEYGLRLPVLPARGAHARALEQELSVLLQYAPLTADRAPWPVIGRGGLVAALDAGAPLHTAGWERCLALGEAWIEALAGLQDRARRIAAHGVAAIQGVGGQKEQPASGGHAPLSDWVALEESRPDVGGVLLELRSRCAGLEERLRTGIESREGETLLGELQRVLQEIQHKPWADVVDPMREMKRAYAAGVDELQQVIAQLGSLSGQDLELDRRQQALSYAERSIRDLVGQMGQLDRDLSAIGRDAQTLHESARQLQAALDQRMPRAARDSPLDPGRVRRDLDRFQDQIRHVGQQLEAAARAGQATQWSDELSRLLGIVSGQAQELLNALQGYAGHWESMIEGVKQTRTAVEGEINEWGRFRRRVDDYGREASSALGTLTGLDAGLQELKSSLEGLKQRLGGYQASALQITIRMQELVGRSEATVGRIDAHLDKWERALDQSRRDVDRIKDEYHRRIDREKTRVRQEIEQLQARQERVGWVARDPANMIGELVGCPVERVSRLCAVPQGVRVQEAIAGQIERAVESIQARIDGECARRIDVIHKAQAFADGALQVQPGNAGEADLLLVPIWYVEWRKTPNPKDRARQHVCYRLAMPLRIVVRDGRRIVRPLYPALTSYLRGLPGLGEWEGEFEVGGEPQSKLAARVRRHVCLNENEIEALVAGMRALVARQVYPPGYDVMVDKSRDDLSEWREPAGKGGA